MKYIKYLLIACCAVTTFACENDQKDLGYIDEAAQREDAIMIASLSEQSRVSHETEKDGTINFAWNTKDRISIYKRDGEKVADYINNNADGAKALFLPVVEGEELIIFDEGQEYVAVYPASEAETYQDRCKEQIASEQAGDKSEDALNKAIRLSGVFTKETKNSIVLKHESAIFMLDFESIDALPTSLLFSDGVNTTTHSFFEMPMDQSEFKAVFPVYPTDAKSVTFTIKAIGAEDVVVEKSISSSILAGKVYTQSIIPEDIPVEPTPDPTPSTNILKGGDIDSAGDIGSNTLGLNAWASSDINQAFVAGAGKDETKGLVSTIKANMAERQVVIKVPAADMPDATDAAGVKYKYSFDIKSTANFDISGLCLSNGAEDHMTFEDASVTADWKRITGTFTLTKPISGQAVRIVRLYVKDTAEGDKVYFDNFDLRIDNGSSTSEELLTGGDIDTAGNIWEQGKNLRLQAWASVDINNAYSNGVGKDGTRGLDSKITKNAEEGNRQIIINATAEMMPDPADAAGVKYRYSFDVKCTREFTISGVCRNNLDYDGLTNAEMTFADAAVTKDWKRLTGEFTLTAAIGGAGARNLLLSVIGVEIDDHIYFDNFSLVRVE